MRNIFIFCLLYVIISVPALAADWLPNFEDVPKMERTFVVEDGGFVFSTGDLRIIETTVISGEVTRRQFQRFYSDAMAELGWRRIENSRTLQVFVRGYDRLRIEIVSDRPLEARFIIAPR